jgi:serine/threonine protein kinase
VRAYEVVPEPPTVILEALTGKTLERRLELEGRLPIDEVVAIGTQLCSVLHYLHGLSLLHLDLKPSNIVCERGLIKLLDLSIARPPGRSRSGIGTRMYMAPEQARGGLVSAATDVWGMGIVLFECASGRRPFGQSAAGATYPQLVDRAPSIGHFRRRMPTQLRQLIDASLAPTASERPSLREISCTLIGLAQAD